MSKMYILSPHDYSFIMTVFRFTFHDNVSYPLMKLCFIKKNICFREVNGLCMLSESKLQYTNGVVSNPVEKTKTNVSKKSNS